MLHRSASFYLLQPQHTLYHQNLPINVGQCWKKELSATSLSDYKVWKMLVWANSICWGRTKAPNTLRLFFLSKYCFQVQECTLAHNNVVIKESNSKEFWEIKWHLVCHYAVTAFCSRSSDFSANVSLQGPDFYADEKSAAAHIPVQLQIYIMCLRLC